MSKFNIDGVIVNTEKAKYCWKEDTYWNGRNHISVNTGSQWEHETLYLSSKNNWYIVHTSQWQGSRPQARFVTEEEAAKWLLLNRENLPDELKHLEIMVEE